MSKLGLLVPGKRKGDGSSSPLAPWKVAIELARLMAVLLFLSLGTNLFQFIWHQTHPLTVKEPVYVEFQTGANNFVTVARAGQDITRNDRLIAMEMRRYVAAREPKNNIDETERYTVVKALSSEKQWKDFKERYGGKDGLLACKECRRDIRILRDSRLTDGAHQVEFEMRDWKEGLMTQDSAPWVSWVATIAYEFVSEKKRFDDSAINGTGISVTEYNLSRRGK